MADNKEFIAWLKRARALVAKGWTQGFSARRADGRVALEGDDATCFCIIGAMERTKPTPDADWLWENKAVWEGPADWNDAEGRTQAEVLAMFTNSIAALGG